MAVSYQKLFYTLTDRGVSATEMMKEARFSAVAREQVLRDEIAKTIAEIEVEA